MHRHLPVLLLLASAGFPVGVGAQDHVTVYQGWQQSGTMTLLTTPEGANLPAAAVVEQFPVLVRLHRDWFDFSKAKPRGDDLRFSSASGVPLAYQIEQWDAANGNASIWVRVPKISGNERQSIRLHWGKADAVSESNGKAVFSSDNGFVSVIHMDQALKDELATVTPVDRGTTTAVGMIGESRHFVAGQGIACGDHITGYPFSDGPFTTEAWFRADATDASIVYWGRYATRFNGKTGDGNEVDLHIGSPASLRLGTDGPGGVHAATPPTMGRWQQVAITYDSGHSLIYVDGKLDGKNFHKAAMSLVQDITMSIGGMRGSNYRFAGEIDEVRVSRVARSADWLRLQYANQNAMQTLVGPLMQPGSEFALSHSEITVMEGASVTITAKAGGAQKIAWSLLNQGVETVVAVDRFSYTLPAGRVTADTARTLRFTAVYANEIKTKDIPVTIRETIPEPVVAITVPATWNGRDRIDALANISNLVAMQTKNAGEVTIVWSVSGGAVIKQRVGERLTLLRSQYSGPLTVTATVSNGGQATIASAKIQVQEPQQDPWIQRVPGKSEQPEENQFYARDDRNEGTLVYNGTIDQTADAVFLTVYADDKLYKTERQQLAADKTYAFTVKLKPGLVRYSATFGTKTGGNETVLKTVKNLVCGDAYIIQGQSNAEASGENNGKTTDPVSPWADWVRSYGNQHRYDPKGGWGNAVRTRIWGKPDYGFCQIGAWGMVLGNGLVEKYKIPVCFINGAVGGTRIDQHQRHPTNPTDPETIYGRLLARIQGAKLTHGIRGVLWHQGENNQGSASPTGDYDWKSYQQYFVELSAAWKQDYPNIQYYYMYQIWPSGCNMGGTPAGDMLLEVQRTMPSLYSNVRIMSTLGITSPTSGRGLCHFDPEGYAQIATLMSPVLEQDSYGSDRGSDRGRTRTTVLTAPNLRRAQFVNAARTEITLEYDQPMAWKDVSKTWFELDGSPAKISTGTVAGNVITLTLSAPTQAATLAYVSGRTWDGKPDRLLYGTNGIAALACSAVPLAGPAK